MLFVAVTVIWRASAVGAGYCVTYLWKSLTFHAKSVYFYLCALNVASVSYAVVVKPLEWTQRAIQLSIETAHHKASHILSFVYAARSEGAT